MKKSFLNLVGHKNSPMITAFVCIIICLILISYGQSQEINALKGKIEYQSNYIEEIDNNVLKPLGINKRK
jgi:predicted Holliday junction resolvase-like endonuclease|tara:strand:+ start:228 stop:437 length:210 start_codon:yes stop_codon:yes gene_type:complete